MAQSRKLKNFNFEYNIRADDIANLSFFGLSINQNLKNKDTKKIDTLINEIDDVLNS